MSIPHSRLLSVSKGIGAAAEFHSNSPNSTQVVNVNINKQTNERSAPPDPTIVTYTSDSPAPANAPITDVNPPANASPYVPVDVSPYADVKKAAPPSNNEELLQYKDNVIEALSTMLQIVENNPLIVNKYIIASAQDLTQLIKLLTGADNVQLNLNNDIECSCTGSTNYSTIDKIYIIKGGETLNFKYSFPDANKILDDHHISVKLVCA